MSILQKLFFIQVPSNSINLSIADKYIQNDAETIAVLVIEKINTPKLFITIININLCHIY